MYLFYVLSGMERYAEAAAAAAAAAAQSAYLSTPDNT
jgi:hypothetical protein